MKINKQKFVGLLVAVILMLISNTPINAIDSSIDSGYVMPTAEEQLKATLKANAVLTMNALQEKGQFQLSAAIGKTIFGKDYVVNSRRISNSVTMTHYSQENSYYCCPAACRSIISVHMSSPPSQSTLAQQLGTTIEGTDFSPIIATVLNRYISSPAGYQIQWHTNNSDIAILIRSDIDNGYGVLANGCSIKGEDNYISGYPIDYDVHHYVAIYGYAPFLFKICDPAYGLPDFDIMPKYDLDYNTFMEFIKDKGIVW